MAGCAGKPIRLETDEQRWKIAGFAHQTNDTVEAEQLFILSIMTSEVPI